MSNLRLVKDSVAGQKCIIIYDGAKPLYTLWEGEDVNAKLFELKLHLSGQAVKDLEALLETMKTFDLTIDQISQAAATFIVDNQKKET